MQDEDLNKPNFEQMQSPYENRFPLNMGTVGMVAATGQTANFPDNSEDSSFEDDHYIRNGKIKKAITALTPIEWIIHSINNRPLMNEKGLSQVSSI